MVDEIRKAFKQAALDLFRRRYLKVDMDFKDYVAKQIEWSKKTFGEGRRVVGICRHIEKELKEIIDSDGDPMEWIDVIILALDGAWRSGLSEDGIAALLKEKQAINFQRTYPRPVSEDEPSEHDRSKDEV